MITDHSRASVASSEASTPTYPADAEDFTPAVWAKRTGDIFIQESYCPFQLFLTFYFFIKLAELWHTVSRAELVYCSIKALWRARTTIKWIARLRRDFSIWTILPFVQVSPQSYFSKTSGPKFFFLHFVNRSRSQGHVSVVKNQIIYWRILMKDVM